MTRSALANTFGGIVSPIRLAVPRLITNSKATTLVRVRCKALLSVIYCLASRDAFPLTVELHRPSADGKVGCNF